VAGTEFKRNCIFFCAGGLEKISGGKEIFSEDWVNCTEWGFGWWLAPDFTKLSLLNPADCKQIE